MGILLFSIVLNTSEILYKKNKASWHFREIQDVGVHVHWEGWE